MGLDVNVLIGINYKNPLLKNSVLL